MVLTDLHFSGDASWRPNAVGPWKDKFPQSGQQHSRSGDTLRQHWRGNMAKTPEELRRWRGLALNWSQSPGFLAQVQLYKGDPFLAVVPAEYDKWNAQFELGLPSRCEVEATKRNAVRISILELAKGKPPGWSDSGSSSSESEEKALVSPKKSVAAPLVDGQLDTGNPAMAMGQQDQTVEDDEVDLDASLYNALVELEQLAQPVAKPGKRLSVEEYKEQKKANGEHKLVLLVSESVAVDVAGVRLVRPAWLSHCMT